MKYEKYVLRLNNIRWYFLFLISCARRIHIHIHFNKQQR